MLSESHKSRNARLNILLKVIRKTVTTTIQKIKTLLTTKLKTKHNFPGSQKNIHTKQSNEKPKYEPNCKKQAKNIS